MYSSIKIFYFSGTGNAMNVANWVAQTAELKSIATQIEDIGKLENRKTPLITPLTTIGFISPTHGFNFPPVMMHFIFRMPRAKDNKVFLMNTRAGMKAGKYFLPGLSGIALLLAAVVLFVKGYKIIGMQSIDLPSNWISIHPALKPNVVQSIYRRRKKDTLLFARKIMSGKKSFRALFNIIQDVLLLPIAALYYIIGRFLLAKSFIASSNCSKCGLCVKNCPVNAIKWVDSRPFWTYKCESCMKCMNTCPERAIETAHGFFIGTIVLIKSVILYFIYSKLHIYDIISSYLPKQVSELVINIVNVAIYFVVFMASYFVLHYLMRIKLIERLVVFTSLTKFKFWRRYIINHKKN